MRKHTHRLGLLGTFLTFAVVGGSTAIALPAQASVHAQATTNTTTSTSSHAPTTTGQGASTASSHQPAQAINAQANAQTHLVAAQLTACNNREAAINNILSRIDTRAQNQITLFGTIATRVENFYATQGKTLSNYTQLVAAINTAQAQTNTDFGTMHTNSTFSCSASNPKGMVTAFQSYLKTEITDLQNYRTAVKNLIVGVASVNGVTVSSSNQSSTQGGQ